MKAGAAIALALTGCVDTVNAGGPWLDASTITGTLAPEVGPPPPPPAAPAGCRLRIATWNVHFAPDPDALAASFLANPELARADVLVVQEIRAFPDEPATRASRLASALAMTWVYAPARTVDGGTHGLAIFSRFPLASAVVRQLPYIDQPINPEQRIALAAQLDLGDEWLPLVDVHLDVRLNAVDRIRQLDPAVNSLGDRLLVGGDLNTTPWEFVDAVVPLTGTVAVTGVDQAAIVDRFMSDLGFAGAIDPDVETFPVPALSIRLDNIYTRGPAPGDSRVEQVTGSDHWPVWFDVDRCPTS
jgi:endonuclease/exonuclease/phosphatase family metal-dependent hydrolase